MLNTPISMERRGSAALLTLNRPKALNALDLSMLTTMRSVLREWQADRSITALILRGEGKAFCAGGDVKAVAAQRGDPVFLDEVYRVEYEVDLLLHRFGRPVIALTHGVTMGGGCGISLHASHPVAAEDLILAMPETAIGFFPDVAGSLFLSRCPGNIGLFMALTGARIGAADALAFGLVKAIVKRERHEALVTEIAAGEDIEESINKLAIQPPPELNRLDHRNAIQEIFQGESAYSIVKRLENDSSTWAQGTLLNLRSQCPFSLEITTRAFSRARGRDLAEVLASDFRVAQRLTMRNDYKEGVRARLVDRDQKPQWDPKDLESVDLAEIDACFSPLATAELLKLNSDGSAGHSGIGWGKNAAKNKDGKASAAGGA
jgi:enoyl-CoA hydratase